MFEIIVGTARSIACVPRLRILSRLAGADECTPTDLVDLLGMPPDKVSAHLRRLSAAGLITRQRSGTWCRCKAQSRFREGTLSAEISSWLRAVLTDPEGFVQRHELAPPQDSRPPEAETLLHGLIFEVATAFTDLRRLQILRRLKDNGEAEARTLMAELHMSDAAVSRHIDKLVRRGYVEVGRAGRRLVCRLASDMKTPIHERLFEIVRSKWAGT